MIRPSITHLLVCVCLLNSGCKDVFDVHPYEVDLDGEELHINRDQIQLAKQVVPDGSTSFNMLVLADPQGYYGELHDLLDAIENDDLDFAVVLGDLTRIGILEEFDWYRDAMETYRFPYVSIIGNHDHLNNGRIIYERMFGPRDFTFTIGGVHFVCYDNTVYEAAVPMDLNVLRAMLSSYGTSERVVLLAHIPPWDGQFTPALRQQWEQILLETNVDLALYGHLHNPESMIAPPLPDQVAVGMVEEDNYAVVRVTESTLTWEHKTQQN